MSETPENPFDFWHELKRRRVIRIIPVYAAAAFVLLELVDIVSEPLRLPDWTINLVLVLLSIGFVISIILSWVYDITPEGVQKTKPSSQNSNYKKQPASRGWKISTYVSILVIISFVVFYILGNLKQSSDISKLEKSIAVLPFDNMSEDEKYSHLGDAITDEIILELQNIKEFDRVISRTSTMQYKENRPTIPEIAAKLRVNYIIEGSIQRYKDEVSIRVQVIRAKHEDHVWGDEYNGKWGDIFSIQDEIAFKVANELKTVLSPEEIRKIEKKPTENLEAYNLYMQGRYCIAGHTEVGYWEGIQYFKKAIDEDKNYALAYVWLAFCYNELSRAFNVPPDEGYQKAKEHLEKAIELDDTNGEAYAMLAFIRFVSDWDMDKPKLEFIQALELSPRSVEAYQLYAQYLMWTNQIDKAIVIIKRAIEIDPFNVRANFWLAAIYLYGNRYEESILQLNKILELEPKFIWTHVYLAHNYSLIGNYSKANYHADMVSSSEDHLLLSAIGGDYARSGRKKTAKEILNLLLGLSENESVDPIMISLIYAGLGDREKTLDWIKTGYTNRSGLMVYLKVYSKTFLNDIKSDPRLKDILFKMGFED